ERRMLFEKNAFGLRPRTSAASRGVREADHAVPVSGQFPSIEECFLRRMLLAFGRERAPRDGVSERRIMPCQQAGDTCREKNAFGLRPRTSAARRRLGEAGHSVASRRAIPVDREMHFGLRAAYERASVS